MEPLPGGGGFALSDPSQVLEVMASGLVLGMADTLPLKEAAFHSLPDNII